MEEIIRFILKTSLVERFNKSSEWYSSSPAKGSHLEIKLQKENNELKTEIEKLKMALGKFMNNENQIEEEDLQGETSLMLSAQLSSISPYKNRSR